MRPEGLTATPPPMGRWRNPLLAYVVAELAIAPHYGLAAKIAAIQDGLRGAFPRTVEATEVVLAVAGALPQGTPGSPGVSGVPAQPFWQLLDATQSRGVLITYRAIALHATAYEDSTDFLRRWAEVLAVIDAAKAEPFVERIGLRYIDLIVPSGQADPADYLVSSIRGIDPPEGAEVQTRSWGLHYVRDGVTVQVRTTTPAPVGLLLPPVLNTLPLQLPPVAIEAQARIANRQTIGWVDTDVSTPVQKSLNTEDISASFERLRQAVSVTFRSLLSDHAKDEWI
jgi:uncharacterized protein (TIGR04255 family)